MTDEETLYRDVFSSISLLKGVVGALREDFPLLLLLLLLQPTFFGIILVCVCTYIYDHVIVDIASLPLYDLLLYLCTHGARIITLDKFTPINRNFVFVQTNVHTYVHTFIHYTYV
jgi:hypothetical protein